MKFVSISNPHIQMGLPEAVSACIAPDGSLLLPERIPVLPGAFFNNISELTLREIAYVVVTSFFGDDLPPQDLKRIADRAFAMDIPLSSPAGKGAPYLLELYHGPTLTCKDFGAVFMAGIIDWLRTRHKENGNTRNILLASAGYSAVAIASAFRNIPDVELFIVSPHGSLKRRRHSILSSFGPRIHILEAHGNIDNCNAMVRGFISESRSAGDLLVGGANSVNIARLIPPVVFFFHAYARLCAIHGPEKAARAVYVVPCGNLTMLCAAVIATRMGLPVGRIVASSSCRDALGRYLRNDSDTSTSPSDLAPSMNSAKPTNLPRLDALCGGREGIEREIDTASVSDDEIAETMRRMRPLLRSGLCPHSAVAWSVAERYSSQGVPVVALATSHPAVDIDIYTSVTGAPVELPHQLTRLMNTRLAHVERLAPTVQALRKCVRNMK
ncbi:MAG: pyridoxal-phosphate dependent enzyme [Muribaculaceae bacterium]|nr:pyridoxal-phosphate dependent enzyme [Muribaculaceae bacterium]